MCRSILRKSFWCFFCWVGVVWGRRRVNLLFKLSSFDVLDISYFINYHSLRKRKRRTDVVVVRGRLRLYSASGFFLLLGLVILAIGIGMATLGYWPQSEAIHPAKTRTGVGPDPSNGTSAYASPANATEANTSTFNNVQGE